MYWMSQDAHYKYIKKRPPLTTIKIISCACLIQEVTTKTMICYYTSCQENRRAFLTMFWMSTS